MKYQNIKSFAQHLPKGGQRVYLVQIASDQERLDLFDTIIDQAIPKDHSLSRFSSDTELREVFDALASPSLFGGDAVVVLDGCEAFKKKEVELLTQFIENNIPSGYLLLGSRGKTPLSKVVEKLGLLLDMSEEKPWEKEKRFGLSLSEIAQKEGKRLSPDAIPLLIELGGTDISMLSKEVEKLICYVGDHPTIERSDVFRLCGSNVTETPWQTAEEIVWEGRASFDAATFPALIFGLRSQLQLGLKITSLIEEGVLIGEWAPYFPKIWPKTLEKRKEQAARKGSSYFKQGLELLFKIESMSRMGGVQMEALFDLFRTTLGTYAKR